MKRPVLIRLSPEAAGELQIQHDQTASELKTLTRYSKEFESQLKELIGDEALRNLHVSTKNALLLADLVKEAA